MKEKIIKLYREFNHFGNQLNMDFEILAPGKVLYKMKVGKEHLATPIAAHGGALAGLMDATLGVAGLSKMAEHGKIVSTVEFKINYLAPAKIHDELEALGHVISAGKRILYIEGEIYKFDGEEKIVIAKANGTFNAYPAEKAKMHFIDG
ncbi:uncharacterized domain 1-containing protein [Lishizhenia tianjinensis]|uniref:Uncharacterized domain 1-containing protein n=1 Tax=Lishizhenia tianjinensis TaxID=477690 RepID=A0A1I7AFY8_9FLAO|nr:PaaI family thioesterase [Lishizhenia tianjinensis]SFT73834.1 uncharacterized domain 1-containing protein [Lishizhenia tianjinensis]